jgi:hypothetical protein
VRRRSELCFVFIRLIAGSKIAAVGRADLRHVIIVFAPCIIAAAARDVSCLLPLLAFCGSSSAPVTKNILADTQTLRYTVAPSIGERELRPAAGRLRRFSPKDESRVRELWLKLPAKPVC